MAREAQAIEGGSVGGRRVRRAVREGGLALGAAELGDPPVGTTVASSVSYVRLRSLEVALPPEGRGVGGDDTMRQMVQLDMGGVIVAAHTENDVPDAEWAEFMQLLTVVRRREGQAQILVRTSGGGGPNSKQRNLLANLGRKVRAAIVTESSVIRGVVTVIAWLQSMEIRAFAPTEWGSERVLPWRRRRLETRRHRRGPALHHPPATGRLAR